MWGSFTESGKLWESLNEWRGLTRSDKECRREWRGVTRSDNEWRRATTGDDEWRWVTTSDDEWRWVTANDGEWRRVTASDGKWRRVTARDDAWWRVTTCDDEWRRVAMTDTSGRLWKQSLGDSRKVLKTTETSSNKTAQELNVIFHGDCLHKCVYINPTSPLGDRWFRESCWPVHLHSLS